jgi:signal transduction histidine kinase
MAAEEPPRRRFIGSVRIRLTAAALLVTALALVGTGVFLVWAVHRSLVDNQLTAVRSEAQALASAVSNGSDPDDVALRPDTGAQVVDAAGRVEWRSSSVLYRHRPVTGDRPPAGQLTTLSGVGPALAGDDDADSAVALTVRTAQGPKTVYILASDEPVENPTRLLSLGLLVGLPALLVVAGLVAWSLAGRALRPVEAIRVEVAGISEGDLDRRVPVPPGNDEVGRLARTMNRMLARLERTSAQRRQFVSDASHELRSPLAALRTQLEVARASPASSDWPAVSATVLSEARRLEDLVDDLLLLAQSDEGQLLPGHQQVDLDELVLAEGERLRLQGRPAVDLHGVGAGRVLGDPGQLRRLVRNLVDNAERHAAGTVTLAVRRHDDTVVLEVADDGPGVPPADAARIFERFTRLEPSRDRRAGGTGLGLSIVGAIAAAHGGTVSLVEDAPGAHFRVCLPAAGATSAAGPADG